MSYSRKCDQRSHFFQQISSLEPNFATKFSRFQIQIPVMWFATNNVSKKLFCIKIHQHMAEISPKLGKLVYKICTNFQYKTKNIQECKMMNKPHHFQSIPSNSSTSIDNNKFSICDLSATDFYRITFFPSLLCKCMIDRKIYYGENIWIEIPINFRYFNNDGGFLLEDGIDVWIYAVFLFGCGLREGWVTCKVTLLCFYCVMQKSTNPQSRDVNFNTLLHNTSICKSPAQRGLHFYCKMCSVNQWSFPKFLPSKKENYNPAFNHCSIYFWRLEIMRENKIRFKIYGIFFLHLLGICGFDNG